MRYLPLILVLIGVSVGNTASAAPPNIVFIFADDLGWTDLGCTGSGYYETPHIDRLRSQGVRFTSAYTNGPNCAPTRAALMTGQYAPRHGIYTVGSGMRGRETFRQLVPVENRTSLPLSVITLAESLQSGGYVTGHFGKWHLGPHPSQQGFDEAFVTSGGHHRFRVDPPGDIVQDRYLADHLTDRAVDFIERHKDGPFFLYLPHFAVHTPIEAKADQIARFRVKTPAGGHHNPVYAGMIASLDDSVGRITAKLDALGLSNNTIVVFYSDNGGHGGYDGIGGSTGKNITSNAPLRGGKGMLYEGGVRVPLIVRWPGVADPGSTCDVPVISIDFYPTLLEIAGASPPSDHTLDGVSFLPLIRDPQARLAREAIYWHFPGYLEANVAQGTWRTTPAGAIRQGDWKLIEFFETGTVELYNLADDIGESRDLATSQADTASALRAQLKSWRQEIQAPMPTSK